MVAVAGLKKKSEVKIGVFFLKSYLRKTMALMVKNFPKGLISLYKSSGQREREREGGEDFKIK